MIIREATPGDSFSIAKIHVDLWNSTYGDIIPEEYLEGRTYDMQQDRWMDRLFDNPDTREFMYVAENEDGEIVGFASGSPESGEEIYDSILYTLYVDEDYQGQGIGHMLIKAVVERLKKMNANSMITWVFEANPSKGFYERLGGVIVNRKTINKGGTDIPEIAFGWKDIDAILYA